MFFKVLWCQKRSFSLYQNAPKNWHRRKPGKTSKKYEKTHFSWFGAKLAARPFLRFFWHKHKVREFFAKNVFLERKMGRRAQRQPGSLFIWRCAHKVAFLRSTRSQNKTFWPEKIKNPLKCILCTQKIGGSFFGFFSKSAKNVNFGSAFDRKQEKNDFPYKKSPVFRHFLKLGFWENIFYEFWTSEKWLFRVFWVAPSKWKKTDILGAGWS